MASSVRVVARITAQPGKEQELKAVLLRVIEPTRGEPGCLRYELYESDTDATDFVFLEEWTDNAAIAAHMQSAHVQEALSKAATLLAGPPDIRRYHRVP